MSVLFAAADEEAFEDNSEEYIRRDLEGSGMCFGFLLLVSQQADFKAALFLVNMGGGELE